MDHDQRFKELLKEFLAEFLALFFAAWAARLDLTAPEWLDKEIFPDPPRGKRRILDLVVKVKTRQPVPEQRPGEGDRLLALLHIEIESEETTVPLSTSVHEAYEHLRRKHRLPVLPIAVYLRVGLDGLGVATFVEKFWDLEVVRFQYLYVGLPGLPSVPYRHGDNWLGVALSALMRTPRDERVDAALEAINRVIQSPENELRKQMLVECIEAYAPFDDAQRGQFDHLLNTGPFQEIRAMFPTTFDRIRAEEREEGRREMLQAQIEERFGPLSLQTLERLKALSKQRLFDLGKALLRANSLRELGLED